MSSTAPGYARALTGIWDGFWATFLAWSPPPRPVVSWDPPRRIPRFTWLRGDTVFWLATIAVFGIGLAAGQQWSGVGSVVVGVLAAVPLILAHYNMLVGWRVAVAVSTLAAVIQFFSSGLDGVTAMVAVGLPLFTSFVAVTHRRAIGLWGWTVTVPIVSTVMMGPLGVVAIFGGLLALVTDGMRSRRVSARELVHERERSATERALRVAAEDRSRMARELHDVVAHHMSMVAVRAETARYRIDGLSDEAKSELAEISAAARESLDEIRGLLGVLRDDNAPRVPQPDLSQVDELVAAANSAGANVELHVTGRRRHLRPALELSAYRILQESLSNVTRHAPGETAEVRIDYRDDNLILTVVNTASGPVGAPGHGITGMRERAKAVGGNLDAGYGTDGRFVVEAVFSVEP